MASFVVKLDFFNALTNLILNKLTALTMLAQIIFNPGHKLWGKISGVQQVHIGSGVKRKTDGNVLGASE